MDASYTRVGLARAHSGSGRIGFWAHKITMLPRRGFHLAARVIYGSAKIMFGANWVKNK